MLTAFLAGGITGAVMTMVLTCAAMCVVYGGWRQAAGAVAVQVAYCMRRLLEMEAQQHQGD